MLSCDCYRGSNRKQTCHIISFSNSFISTGFILWIVVSCNGSPILIHRFIVFICVLHLSVWIRVTLIQSANWVHVFFCSSTSFFLAILLLVPPQGAEHKNYQQNKTDSTCCTCYCKFVIWFVLTFWNKISIYKILFVKSPLWRSCCRSCSSSGWTPMSGSARSAGPPSCSPGGHDDWQAWWWQRLVLMTMLTSLPLPQALGWVLESCGSWWLERPSLPPLGLVAPGCSLKMRWKLTF